MLAYRRGKDKSLDGFTVHIRTITGKRRFLICIARGKAMLRLISLTIINRRFWIGSSKLDLCVIASGTTPCLWGLEPFHTADEPILPARPLTYEHSSRPDPHSCLILSASLFFPNSSRLYTPCSLKSTPLSCTSCAGGRVTLLATTTGSTSSMMPSSQISSMARETRS